MIRDPQDIELTDPAVIELLRQRTPRQRAEMADQMTQDLRRAVVYHLKIRHPGWTARQINSELIWRYYGVHV
ncbi:MAG: hypothetical protein ACYC26_09630 [Phycisphaerales bacterium]